jgi:hypothetical protein
MPRCHSSASGRSASRHDLPDPQHPHTQALLPVPVRTRGGTRAARSPIMATFPTHEPTMVAAYHRRPLRSIAFPGGPSPPLQVRPPRRVPSPSPGGGRRRVREPVFKKGRSTVGKGAEAGSRGPDVGRRICSRAGGSRASSCRARRRWRTRSVAMDRWSARLTTSIMMDGRRHPVRRATRRRPKATTLTIYVTTTSSRLTGRHSGSRHSPNLPQARRRPPGAPPTTRATICVPRRSTPAGRQGPA